MKTLKPTTKRRLMLALMLPVLAIICSCQSESIYVSTPKSESHELAAFECNPAKDEDETTVDETTKEVEDEKDCPMDEMAVLIREDEEDDCINNPLCYNAYLMTMPAPNPCPSIAHCIPFWSNPRVCFYSEADKRPVEIYVGDQLIGKATDISYDARRKLRTVSFDLKKNLQNTASPGENVMTAKIPVTYPVLSKEGKPTGQMMQEELQFAAKF